MNVEDVEFSYGGKLPTEYEIGKHWNALGGTSG